MTGRDLLQDAWKAIQRNQALVLAFVLAAAGLELGFRLAAIPIPVLPDGAGPPGWARAYDLALQIAHAAAFSVLAAVVYSRLGKDIDRPLWKCASDAEAVRRFFMAWFLLNLVVLLLYRLQFMAYRAESTDLVILLEFLIMMAFAITTPIGACIMYHGGLDWAHFGQSLRPIARQFGLAFLAIFLAFLGYFLLNVARALDPEIHKRILVPAGITIPLALLDALVFCVMWRVCMINRDTPEEDSDDLF